MKSQIMIIREELQKALLSVKEAKATIAKQPVEQQSYGRFDIGAAERALESALGYFPAAPRTEN